MIRFRQVPKTVLIVAEVSRRLKRITAGLRSLGCDVRCVNSADNAVGCCSGVEPEVILVDARMSGICPMQLASRIRHCLPPGALPLVIVLPLHEWQFTQVPGHPPANPRLSASQHPARPSLTVLQTGASPDDTDRIRSNGLEIDRGCHRARVDGGLIHLTPTEFNLLWELASRPGVVFSRADLARVCRKTAVAMRGRTIDAHIKAIRRKLMARADLIQTVHGVGYRFCELECAAGGVDLSSGSSQIPVLQPPAAVR